MLHKTRLSSKGQVVIPAWVRQRLKLAPGDELRVEIVDAGDRTILLRGASKQDIEHSLRKGYAWLERSGYDPVAALHEARRQERERRRR